MRIIAPGNGLTLFRDPTLPAERNTIAFQAEADPAVPELLWMIDGKPYRLAAYPYTVRWPLQAGEHVIQVAMPFSRTVSVPVRLRVQ